MTSKLPNIAVVGNAPQDKYKLLNDMLSEEELSDLCNVVLYGADGQPYQDALYDAIEDWHDGSVQGIVCLPSEMSVLETVKDSIDGITQNLFSLCVNSTIKIVSVCPNANSGEADRTMNKDALVERVRQVAAVLKRDFFILNPRLALLPVLNKDTGMDVNVIAESVIELVNEGIQAYSVSDTDSFLESKCSQVYDAAVTFGDSNELETLVGIDDGLLLSLVCGTEIPLVQTGYEGLLAAVFLVMDVVRNRAEYDRPFANPLPKLYNERREDGEKARFAIKKKGFNPAEHKRENVVYTSAPAQKE